MKGIIGCLGAIAIFAMIIFLFWLVCNALVWAICFCFGLGYTLLFGTGVWLIIIFLMFVVSLIRGSSHG